MKDIVRDSSHLLMSILIVGLSILFSSARPCISAQSLTIDIEWLPVTEAERNMKSPVVDKNAGVEAIFWRVHVLDEDLGQDLQRVLYHYVRLKVFNEKGKEKAATIGIPFENETSITRVAGRTIKADGTELELKKDSVFERDLVKGSGSRSKVKSFAMPGVEPGAIVEYRWKEIRFNPSSFYMRLQFQREFPVQKVTYFLKPLSRNITGYAMSVWPMNCTPSPLKPERDGFDSTSLDNVPEFREEPFMPGEPNVRPWALVYYQNGERREPEKYWNEMGKETYRDIEPALKTNNEIKQAATEAVQGTTKAEDKVNALIRYLRSKMRSLYGTQVTEAERAQLLKQAPEHRMRTSAEVFKSGIGTADELNTLFVAMALQAGLGARPALVADREDIIFNALRTDRYFLSGIDAAVNIDGKWRLYDASARLLPANMLSWREEGMSALISDPKKPVFVEVAYAPPEASTRKRTARFTLSEDGTLEGDVDQEYSGHMAFDRRSEMQGQAETRRAELLKEEIAGTFADSEVSAVRIENADDPEKVLKTHYHIKVRGYAQRTGKRLLLQPLFFQRGAAPLFAATDRRYPVFFPYAWTERDEVAITVPEGFSFDNAGNPGSLEFGPPGSYRLELSTRNARDLFCARSLTFGRNGSLYYEVPHYSLVKAVFDEIHRRDNFTISLKQAGEK